MVDAEKRLSQILTEIGNLAPAILNERQQRLISGSIAKGYGYGGDKIVSEAFGIDPRTVSAGRKATEAGRIDDIEHIELKSIIFFAKTFIWGLQKTYKPMRSRDGRLFYVFDEDAAEELLDFQDTFSDFMDTLIETLENLKDAVLSIDVPNIEPFPEPERFPDSEELPQQNDLPF